MPLLTGQIARLKRLEKVQASWPRPRDPIAARLDHAVRVYGRDSPALARIEADPRDPVRYRDLLIDEQWEALELAPVGALERELLPPLATWEEWRLVVFLHAADEGWPWRGLFDELARRGQLSVWAISRFMEGAHSGELVMPELHGPILLEGAWPADWNEACEAAVLEGSGLYMAQRGEHKQAILVDGMNVKARHWKGEWEDVGRYT
jgi:hypothetical protein